jgi:TP901 family phage tail tape measure protein
MAEDMNLQIKITGQNDTGNSFSSLDAAMADLQKLAMDVSKAFEDFAKTAQSSFSAASQSVQDMTAPLQSERTELEAMVQSMGDVDRAATTMGTTASQAGREMQAGMENAVQASRSLESGLAGAQQSIRNTGDAVAATSSSVDRLGQALSAEMIGEQLKQIGETGLKVFESAVHSAADFEFNISRIGAVLTTVGKATNQQMGQMSDDALKIGSNSSFSANQIAEGMYTLARQGLDASTILGDGVNGAINIVNDLAQATDSSMTDTATVITDVVHEYGLSGSELRNVANIMSGTLHNSSESLDDFYQSMKQVGPVASNMHQSVENMSTALALLAQHGITGSSAGTALKNMLLGLQPHTKKAASLMNELGISTKEGAADSFYQLNGNLKPLPDIIDILNQKYGGLNDSQKQAALAATFTKYGLAGLNVVVGESRDKFLAFQNELRADDAATIAGKKMDNLHGDLLKFNAGVQTMMKSFGDSINGMLRPIVQGASEAIKWITELPKPAKEAGMIMLGLGSALAIAGGSVIAFAGGVKMLGPTLEMAGMSTAGLEAAAGTLGAIFSEILIPIALVVAAVAAVALGFKLAYDHIKPFHDAVNNAISTVKQLGEALKGMWQGGAAEGKGISILDNLGFSPASISAIQNVFARIKEGVAAAKQGFDNVKSAVQGIFMILTGTGGGEGISILEKLGFSKNTIQELEKMGGQFKAIFDGIKTAITSALSEASSIVMPIIDGLLSFWNIHQAQFRQVCETVWNAIGSVIRTTVSIIITVISTILDVGQTVFDGIKTAIGKAKDAFQEIKKKVEEFGKSFTDFKDNVVKKVQEKFDDLTDSIKKHKTAIEVTAGILGTIFGPALLLTGTRAAIAGGQIAAQFIVSIVQSGTEAVIAGAKLTASFIASIVQTGVEAVISGAKMTAQFIAAIITAGVEAVVTGAKLTASLIAAVIQLGIETAITAAKITGEAVVALITYAAQGWATTASIVATTGAAIANAAAFVGQKVALFASVAATEAATAAQWLLNAAMDANPIGLLILAIGGLVAAGIYLYQNWDTVKSQLQGILMEIEQSFESALGGAIDLVNNLIGAINHIPHVNIPKIPNPTSNFVDGVDLNLIQHAKGGIFDTPHFGMVAEAGPEAIIPLSNPSRGLALWQQAGAMLGVSSGMALPNSSGGGIVNHITVYANGNITRNEHELGQIVSRAILNQTKMQGRI